MHLQSLSLRNYRAYRELNLEFPDGLCGIYGANATGKCLPGWIRLYDADLGGMVPISQFVADQRKRTLGLRDGKIQPVEVTDWLSLGERPTVEVTLKNGARLEVAETHPILTDRGCVQAKDLTPDHWVAEAAAIPQRGLPHLTVDEAMLLGLLLGDGSMGTERIQFSCADEVVGRLYRELVERIFPGVAVASTKSLWTKARGYYLRSRLDSPNRRALHSYLADRFLAMGVPLSRYVSRISATLQGLQGFAGIQGFTWDALCAIEDDYGFDLSDERCSLHPNRVVCEWIRELGLLGVKSGTKHVPADCLTMPEEQTWALLAGLWLTDGWLVGADSISTPEVALTSKSHRLANDIRMLLLRVGVRSTIRQRVVGGNSYWQVTIQHDGFPALAQMPLVGRKAERRDRILARPPASRPGTRGDMIPPSFNTRISAWRSPTGDYRAPKQRDRPMNRAVYRGFAGPGSVADEETTWSRVASVTPTGRSVPCYDIEVDTPEHLYLAETFIVHNSTLIESIRYSLYGDSRTSKDELRTADVRDDLRVTLVFEHEGNAYEVRRALKGQNFTPEVHVFRNGQLVVSSVREANAFLARVIGMKQDAFLASVCAQQKELTTFASMSPADRRRLVLDLLGVRPIEKALTRAREQARDARREAVGGRRALPSLEEREKAVAEADADLQAADAAAAAAAEAETAAEAMLTKARELVAVAEADAGQLEELRGAVRLARAEADSADAAADGHERRAKDGERAGELLAASQARVEQLPAAQERLTQLDADRDAHQARQAQQRTVADAAARLAEAEGTLAGAEQAAAGADEKQAAVTAAETALAGVVAALEDARTRWAAASGELRAAEARRDAAQAAVGTAASLASDAPCPTCGQVLGEAFTSVREHRAAELAEAAAAAAKAARALAELEAEGDRRRAEQAEAQQTVAAARQALQEALRAVAAAEHAQAARERAQADLAAAQQALEGLPDPAYDPQVHQQARALVTELQAEAARLEGYRAQVAHAQAEAELAAAARERAAAARARTAAAEERAAALAHLAAALAAARAAEQDAAGAARAAHGERRGAQAELAGVRRRLADHTAQLADARAAHEQVAVAEERAAYAEKAAELLGGFRLHLVSRLGGRLTTEAARLFAELTDHTYADLVVDPEDYGIRIADGGIDYDLDRFSGSENDLASLSLRVAISLVIADGARELGLLVLDEVLGSLDRDRRERMLGALTALQGRFRQVLLVTHNEEVKDLLPQAIEVRRTREGTSTARLVS